MQHHNGTRRAMWIATTIGLFAATLGVITTAPPPAVTEAAAPGGCPGGFGAGSACLGYGLTVGLSGGATRWAGSYKNDDDPGVGERWVVGTCVQDTSGQPGANMGPNTAVPITAYAPPGQSTVPQHPELADEAGIARWLLEPTVTMTVPGTTAYTIAGITHTLNQWWAGMWVLGHYVIGDSRDNGSGLPVVMSSTWLSGATTSPSANAAAHDLLAIAQSIPLPWTSATFLDVDGSTVTVTITAANGSPVGSVPTYFDPAAPTTPNVSVNGVAGQSGQPRQYVGATDWNTGEVTFGVVLSGAGVKTIATQAVTPRPDGMVYQQVGGQDLLVMWGEGTLRSFDSANATMTITTTAVDAADFDHVLPFSGGVLTDTVAYVGATVGVAHTVTGTLMLRAADGTVTSTGITAATTFTPTGPDGTVDVTFTVPAGFDGTTLVVYEQVSTAADGLIAEHADPDDAAQTVVAEERRTAEVHLRTVVSHDGATWINAQTGTTPAYDPAQAPAPPWAGSFDDAAPDAGDGLPVYAAGTGVTFRYEVWLDPSATGVVLWPVGLDGVVVDDSGTADQADDTLPAYLGGDDGDTVLEAGEIWRFGSLAPRVATAGETYRNAATIPSGEVHHPLNLEGPVEGATSARRDPAGYAVPAVATTAIDGTDLDKLLTSRGGTVVDTVTYADVVPGVALTVDGALMRVLPGGTVVATGITASVTFTPAAAAGSVDVAFTVPPGFASATLVAYETLRVAATDVVIAAHTDPDDAGQTVTLTEVAADVHLRTTVSAAGNPWVNAQTGTAPTYAPDHAPDDPAAGSFDDAAPDAGDGLPVYAAGSEVSFRYEVWLDPSSTGVVAWLDGPEGIVTDDHGTPADTGDDLVTAYLSGDDGDAVLEPGETWIYETAAPRVAVAGELVRNMATLRQGDVVDPDEPDRITALTSSLRRDPAGYAVPVVATSVATTADGSQVLAPGGGLMVDTVDLRNVVPGVEVGVAGSLWLVAGDGSVSDTGITAAVRVTPAAADDSVAVTFDVPATLAAGRYVVFEQVLAGATVVATHADPTDAAQTFRKRSVLGVATSTCVADAVTERGATTVRTCDRITAFGDPGDVITGRSTAYRWERGERQCAAPGPSAEWRIVIGPDGTGAAQTDVVEVPVGQVWEWVEEARTPDGRTFGRECSSAPRQESESFVVRPGRTCCLPRTGGGALVPLRTAALFAAMGAVFIALARRRMVPAHVRR